MQLRSACEVDEYGKKPKSTTKKGLDIDDEKEFEPLTKLMNEVEKKSPSG